jgi:cell surface protein SprA
MDLDIDTALNYTIYERMGDINYRPPTNMTFQEFQEYQEREQRKSYWKSRSEGLEGEGALGGRNLIPPIYISPVFDRIFGGSYVEIIPKGFVTLDFGGRWQRIESPDRSIRQQRNGGFEFDQNIQMNVVGKIGEKLQVTANFDNNNSFDFENNLKVEYTGFKEDILQKLEIGNVSLPLNNSLITGAQNLFGIKAQMQFGDLYVTTVASTQRGTSESITVDGGGVQGREFEISAANYDENRHFFLGHFFRDNYEKWLNTIPFVQSSVNITRVEVYVVNRSNDTQSLRNVLGMMDMAESKPVNIYRDNLIFPNAVFNNANTNDANNMFDILNGLSREADDVNAQLEGLGFENGVDFEKITSARKLEPNEYTYDSQLGYISLSRKLQNDEALAVAYQYSYQGRVFQVGELTEDYNGRDENEVIFLKLLRPRKINIVDNSGERIPTWDLMMKNVYNLNATSLERENFNLRIIYRDDRTGIDNPQLQEGIIAGVTPLIELLGLDKLNPNNDPQPDGNFDYVEGITIKPSQGLVIFPTLQPFNEELREAFAQDPNQQELINKYVYEELYNQTQNDAELVSSKNKYFLTGRFQSGSANEIVIPGFNISEGSVQVYAGGTPLVEGIDYQVDYTFGKVNIINAGVLNSGKDITVRYEKADLFNFQSRTLLGARLDYVIDDGFTIGGTLLHHFERPLISRVSVGNEPTKNTKYGFDVNIRKDSRFLTKMIDKIPLIQTKEPSSIAFNAEFAQLIPGTSNIVDGEGTSYIDDFESSTTPFTLGNPNSWRLASTPQTPDNRYFGESRDLSFGFKRAKLAWYQIDNLFYRDDNRRPDNITEEEMENHYVRFVRPQEIFPNLDENIINFQQMFNFAYYPEERGQYNYNPNGATDILPDPRSNWGGVTNAIRSEIDFDKANVEYIEFWVMDPFITTPRGQIDDGRGNVKPNTTGGDLYFNLGSISEDVMRDSRHAFENGLPPDGVQNNPDAVVLNDWGYVTRQQFLTPAFDNDPNARENQDVGLDGATDLQESQLFPAYSVNPDPSADNFQYFLSQEFDAINAGVLRRYKNFNGMEGNSPVATNNNDLFVPSGTIIPDNEDLNADNTLNELEEYYEYRVPLRPGQLSDNEYVVDEITSDDSGENVTWYLFRIPIRQFDNKIGNINGFKSIKYIRMYMTNFSEPVVLRMTNFRLVASRWRRYLNQLNEPGFDVIPEPDDFDNFTVSTVNIEENGTPTENRPPYVLPPGFSRDRDNTAAVERRLNEQSIQVCVDDLEDGDARAIYKQVSLDLINYGRVKMFLHADGEAEDDELTAFLRMGSDVDSNYYEIEVPLKMTEPNAISPQDIWPMANEIDLDLNFLYSLKTLRDRNSIPKSQLFFSSSIDEEAGYKLRLRGNPDMSAVTWLTIGIRNPRDNGENQSVCIWANELRVTDFNDTRGWAANATLNAKLADFATVTANIRHSTFGFGGIQSRISERTREEATSYDISTNIAVDKLFPENFGLKIPMYLSYQKDLIKPFFDPANPDISLEASLLSFPTEGERNEYRSIVTDETTTKSLNFTNVRKIKIREDAKKHIYDIENFAFSYAFSERERSNFNLQQYRRVTHDASVAYNYAPQNKPWEPFANWEKMNSPFLQLIKDFNFNPIPTNISVRVDLRRRFEETVYRNEINVPNNDVARFEKFFTMDRLYNVNWNLSRNLRLDYTARANAIIDEPEGRINNQEKRDSIWDNLKHFGRMKNFDQRISFNYQVPLDKIPLTDWLNAEYRYEAGYNWRAGPFYTDARADSLDFGNTIQNSRDNTVTGKLDLVQLYNKVGFLREINTPAQQSRRSSLTNTTQADTVKQKAENKGLKSLGRFIMMVRSLNATYTLREGTIIPGFTPQASFFGMDSTFSAPGLPFILGSQDRSILFDLAEDGYITNNPNLTQPFMQTQLKDFNIRANLEPAKNLTVTLDVRKAQQSSYQELFHATEDNPEIFVSESPNRTGTYAISFMSIRTSFEGSDSKNNSDAFNDFEDYRLSILDRFRERTGVDYDTNSQDILIPAFIAAYSGRDPGKVSLSPFPKTPVPNWRIDYTGLSSIKGLSEIFSSISITHGYQSNYAVNNFTTSLEYNDNLGLDTKLEEYNESYFGIISEDKRVPVYTINQVVITEQFAPLLGINLRTKSRLEANMAYKTKRDLVLNINNSQVTEVKNYDIQIGLGFTKANMILPFRSKGRTIVLKNDLTFRLDLTIRDTQTIQRKIDELNTVTNGTWNFQLRPNVRYVLSDRLSIQAYFERTINEPKISSTPRRSTTRAGFQVRFSLDQ